jgi:hypothetical protein
MRNLIIAVGLTAAVATAGAVGWRAEAANPAAPVPQAAPYTPIHPAACEGRSIDCQPGRHRVCKPDGRTCWCTPC